MKILGSMTFRLALTYAALLLASVGTLAGLYYWLGIYGPLDTVRSEIRADSQRLSASFSETAPETLVPLLEKRAASATTEQAYHALLRPDGTAVATNLPSWPHVRSTEWLRIDADISREGEEDEYEALVFDQQLQGGWRLLIGRDIERLESLEEALSDTAQWLVPALLFLAVTGGFLMSRAIGRRIEAVDGAAQRVMQGDFSERVPMQGTGDDFDRLASTLNSMLDRIEQSLESVRRVSDSVAHELRTPLSRLQAGLFDLAKDAPTDFQSRLSGVQQEAVQLSRIFDAVLRVSRIEVKTHVTEMRPLNLSKLLLDAVEFYEPTAAEKAIALVANVPPELRISGDPDLLFQAASNLLDNAVKFTPAGGRIAVSANSGPEGAWFEISDSGPGIPAEIRDKVTERFFRSPVGDEVPGFGLGLSLVSAVAALHDSELQFADGSPGLLVHWQFPRSPSPG